MEYKLRKVKNKNLYYVNDVYTGRRLTNALTRKQAEDYIDSIFGSNMFGGADDTEDPSITPEIQKIIDDEIAKAKISISVAQPPVNQSVTRLTAQLTGKGSEEPEDAEPDEPPPSAIDEEYITNYLDIQQENHLKTAQKNEIEQKIRNFFNDIDNLEVRNYESLIMLFMKMEGVVTSYKTDFINGEFSGPSRPQYSSTESIGVDPKIKRIYNQKARFENNKFNYYPSAQDPTVQKYFEDFNPFPGILPDDINWRDYMAGDYRTNINFNREKILENILEDLKNDPEYALTPYPTDGNTGDVALVNQEYLDMRKTYETLPGNAVNIMNAIRKMYSEFAKGMIRGELSKSPGDNKIITQYGTEQAYYENILGGLGIDYLGRWDQEIPTVDYREKNSINRYIEIYNNNTLKDANIDNLIKTFRGSLDTSKSKNKTGDDTEFFFNNRIKKHNFQITDVTVAMVLEGIKKMVSAIGDLIPILGDIIGPIIGSFLTGLAGLGYLASGDGKAALIMMDAAAKQLPGVNVLRNVGNMIIKSAKNEPISDEDRQDMFDSLETTAEFVATVATNGAAGAALKAGVKLTKSALKKSVMKSFKNEMKSHLLNAALAAGNVGAEAESNKIYLSYQVAADDSHIEFPFFYMYNPITRNTKLIFMFPEHTTDEIQDMVDANKDPKLNPTGRTDYYIPSNQLFIDAGAKYTPKPGDSDTILWRKLAYQESIDYMIQKENMQKEADDYFNSLLDSYKVPAVANERTELENDIVGTYFTPNNIQQIREDGADENDLGTLKDPLTIPKPEVDVEYQANKPLINTVYTNLTRYIRGLVKEEKTFIIDTMTYIEDYADTIISKAIQELITKLGDQSATFSTDLYDSIYTAASDSLTKILSNQEIEKGIIEEINSIKSENGEFIDQLPPITSQMTGSKDVPVPAVIKPSIADRMKNNALYHLKDLLTKDILDSVPKLKVVYDKGRGNTEQSLVDKSKYAVAVTARNIGEHIDELREQTLRDIDSKYSTITSDLRSLEDWIRSDARNIFRWRFFDMRPGNHLRIFKFGSNVEASIDNMYNTALREIKNPRYAAVKTTLDSLDKGIDLTDRAEVDSIIQGIRDNYAYYNTDAKFIATYLSAALRTNGRGMLTNNEQKIYNELMKQDRDELKANISKNFPLPGTIYLTETPEQLQARTIKFNIANKAYYLQRIKLQYLRSLPYNVTENDVTQYTKPDNTIDVLGIKTAVEAREKLIYPNLTDDALLANYVPETTEKMKYIGPPYNGVGSVPPSYNRFAYIGEEQIEKQNVYDAAYKNYIKDFNFDRRNVTYIYDSTKRMYVIDPTKSQTPLTKDVYIAQNSANFKTQLDAIHAKYESLRNGSKTLKDLPEPLPKYVPPPEIEEPEEEEPEEEEPEEEEPEPDEEEAPEEEETPELSDEQLAEYMEKFNKSVSRLITYLLAQDRVDDSNTIKDLYTIFANYRGEIDEDILSGLVRLYEYQSEIGNDFTIRHYVRPLMVLAEDITQSDELTEAIAEENERQLEVMRAALKLYKYVNPKLETFITDTTTIDDIMKKFPEIQALVKSHPDITDDDLTEMEAEITLNKPYVKVQPSMVQDELEEEEDEEEEDEEDEAPKKRKKSKKSKKTKSKKTKSKSLKTKSKSRYNGGDMYYDYAPSYSSLPFGR